MSGEALKHPTTETDGERGEKRDEMFDNLTLRSAVLATAAIPVHFLALLALWAGAVADELALAAVATVGAVATMIAAHLVGERVTERLAVVAEASRRLAEEELPALFARFDTVVPAEPEPPVGAQPLMPGRGEPPTADDGEDPGSFFWPQDELTSVMRGLADVTPAATRLIAERRTRTRNQLSELVQQLTGRHRALLDQQIDCIDWLEGTDEEPERLRQRFTLDHAANRLRRSSESVLVLTDAEVDRPRGQPSPMATVVRVAIGETEQYQRIVLRSIEAATVAPGATFELAHLLAELMDNASRHSSPAAEIDLWAALAPNGDYRIRIVDHGPGMTPMALTKANVLLAEPPDFDLGQEPTIGLTVVARLAARIGAMVDLTETPTGGVTAVVTVPSTALVTDGTTGTIQAGGQLRVRPYVLTGGRAEADVDLTPETILTTTEIGRAMASELLLERGDIIRLTADGLSLAELAARLGLGLHVARVLAADLIGEGLLAAYDIDHDGEEPGRGAAGGGPRWAPEPLAGAPGPAVRVICGHAVIERVERPRNP